jgi:transcriptional regulator with XRE-family HTH domain
MTSKTHKSSEMHKPSDLKMWRVSLGWTQAEVAKRIGYTQRAVSYAERGHMQKGKVSAAVCELLIRKLNERERDDACR